MEQFWRNTGVRLGKHWKVVAVVLAVITAALSIGFTRVEFATGQDSYLNPDSQIALDNVEFQDNFGGETIILLFTAEDGADVDVSKLYEGNNLATLERLNEELAELDAVYSVVTPLTSLTFSAELVGGPAGSSALTGALSRDEAGSEARTADIGTALARRSAAGDQVIGNPDWNQLLIYGNDNFEVIDGEVIAPPADQLVVRKSLQGTFPNVTDANGNSVGPLNGTAVGGIILDGNIDLDTQSATTEAVLEILDRANFEGFDLTVTGSPVYLAEINNYLQGGMLTLGLAALAVMAVVLGLIFRVRWRLLPLLAVLIGVLWAFALMGLFGIDLSLVTISGLPILIGLGIDFAIQIHNRVEEEVVLDSDEHPIAETVANVAPPLIAATIAGVLAFLALRISKVPMIRDFGVLLAVGIVVLVIVGIVVPVAALGIREWVKPTEDRPESMVEKLVVRLGGLPTKFGLPLVVAAVALFVGGVLVEGETKIQSDPVKWIDQGSQTVADIERLEEATGFGTTLGILVTANNVYDQDVVNLIHDFIIDAEARDDVVSSSSLVNTMAKIIDIDGATVIAPTTQDIVNADTTLQSEGDADIRETLANIERVLVNPDRTATQVNLRLAPASLDERAVLVEALGADLDARIESLQGSLAVDSLLLTDLPEGQTAVRATPAGLATVGIGLLENLSANRANLTYLALCLAGLFLVLRFRSVTRALLALVPVLLAVGASSLIVALIGFELSPLTTVGGPLVIATCAEFAVLILGRYLEERQTGLTPREASDKAAGRTGRAFFTSAMTTIGGFAVLIGSALPLLRDFGIIVTMNVAIALLAALVVMPPLSVWVDERGWLGTQEQGDLDGAVRLAANLPGGQTIGAGVGAVALAAGVVAVYSTADTDSGAASTASFTAVPLPTTTTTTTTTTEPPPTTAPPEGEEPAGPLVDPSGFGVDRPDSLVGGTLFDLLTGDQVGVAPNVANCAIETLASRISDDELLVLGAATAEPAAAELIAQAARDCGITENQIDRAIAIQRNEEPPPAEDAPETTVAAEPEEPAGPEIDPSGFSTDPPSDPIQATVFNLLVGGGGFTGQGLEPMLANCAIETTLADNDETIFTLLAAQDAAAIAAVKESSARCGVEPTVVDDALIEFSGG